MEKNEAVKFYDTTNWQTLSWLSSGGTREKRILQDLRDDKWYFKCSERKPARDGLPEKYYKFEFWSEIISYQIGSSLGLNILRYDIASNEDQVGCISPKMNISDDDQLVEVGRFMTTLNPDFFPDDNQARKEYTFQLLDETLKHFDLEKYRILFFQTLLFDTILGNTDRHQENWAFIWSSYRTIPPNEIDKMVQRASKVGAGITSLRDEIELRELGIKTMAPIYDSGSSLGRELTEKKVESLLINKDQLESYINRGPSEVHWDRKKISHFKLMENILASENRKSLLGAADFLKKWDLNTIENIVYSIDKIMPERYSEYKIPDKRKALIFKLLTLRYNKLYNLING